MVDILMQLTNNDTGDKSLVNPNSSVLLNGGGGGGTLCPLFLCISPIGVDAIGTLGTQALPNKERNLSIRNQKVFNY